MVVIGSLTKSRGRALNKVVVETATGPSAAVTVSAASSADISIPISSDLKNNIQGVGTIKITGLPTNITATQVNFSSTAITLRATNPTASAVSIAANSITVTYVGIGS